MPIERSEEIVAGEVRDGALLGIGPVDDARRQVERWPAFDRLRQKILQDVMIHGREILSDVAFQDKRMTGTRRARLAERLVLAETFA